ncbi:MAG: DNA repair protein RecN [Rhodospirillales bacterium]|nr:DNA repair protein RecN [Rhodospirillales bacterium]
MLQSLSIRDVVLIDRLDLSFRSGLCVLTGETGAGKSILLDALGLALGGRAESRLVRAGAEQASVTAAFDIEIDHPVFEILRDNALDVDDGLILRRTLSAEGRSRAFINDQPVSVALLRDVGGALVEIHGQFETQGLLDPKVHRGLLDTYGGLGKELSDTKKAYVDWRAARDAVAQAEEDFEKSRNEEDFLRHAVEELSVLNPGPGEDEELASRRALMMNGEKLADSLKAAQNDLMSGSGVEGALRSALRNLERIADKADGLLDDAIAALDRAAIEATEGIAQLDRTAAALDLDPRQLEKVEERLFALRAAARKYNVGVDDLAALRERFEGQLMAIEDGGAGLEKLRKAASAARENYVAAGQRLGSARQDSARALDEAVRVELEPLRLGNARFETLVAPLEEADWGESGLDSVAFLVATNPGAAAGPIAKIASGGELARFMLALKVVLAKADPVPTLVFDEVDSGIGGATAAAVGERLSRLADGVQVLVVTHSPQVASRGAHHWRVSKPESGGKVRTTVEPLAQPDRQEEIARMLAGEQVTEEARAAAGRLIDGDMA